MKLSKWSYELIIVAVLVMVGLGTWWYVDTAPQRKADAEVEIMIKYAQRQALEIAIIEQASKLTDYRKQLAAAKNPPPVNPLAPEPIADPKDVNVD